MIFASIVNWKVKSTHPKLEYVCKVESRKASELNSQITHSINFKGTLKRFFSIENAVLANWFRNRTKSYRTSIRPEERNKIFIHQPYIKFTQSRTHASQSLDTPILFHVHE